MRIKTALGWSPVIIVAAAALAPVIWFQTSLPIKSVDSFFSLNPQGHFVTSFRAWDAQMTAGEPSAPQVFLLLNTLQYALVSGGLSLVTEQLVILTLLTSSAVAGTFALMMAILPPDLLIVRRRLAAAIAAIAWVANPFALSFVWWHQTLIEVTWAILPWLLLLLTVAIRRSRRVRTYAPLIVLISVLGAPGLGVTYLPSILILLGATATGLILTERDRGQAFKGAAIFFVTFGVALSWWVIPILGVTHQIYADDVIGQPPLQELRFASEYSSVPNVISLTAILQLWAEVDKARYIPWAPLVTSGLGSTLRFLLPATAVVGFGYALQDKRTRYIAILAGGSGVLAVFGSKGLNSPFPDVNLALLGLPFGGLWRHPVDKLSVLLILPMCVLFGFAISGLLKDRWTAPIAIASALVVCGLLAVPWWSGAVIPDASGDIPSARVQVPTSYDDIGRVLAKAPTGGKTMVLPYMPDGESAFLWTHGIQPNIDCLLQDWAPGRTLLCHGTGQPSANRLVDTLGLGILHHDPRVVDLARLSGVDRWLVHEDWASRYMPTSISPQSATAYLDNPFNEPPAPPIQRAGQNVVVPSSARTMVLYVYSSAAPAGDDRLLQMGSVDLQVNRYDGTTPGIFFGLFDAENRLWLPGSPVGLGVWHKIALRLESGEVLLEVDGIRQRDLKKCDPDCHDQSGSIPLPHATVMKVTPPREAVGATQITQPVLTELDDVPAPIHQSAVAPIMSTPELRLWKQSALPLIYAATTVYVSDLSPEKLLATAHESAGDAAPAILEAPRSEVQSWDPSAWSIGKQDSASKYHGVLRLNGHSILVLLQSFDPGWKLLVDGRPVSSSQHVLVNGFANGWIVSGNRDLSWSLTYDLQPQMDIAYLFGGLLFLGAALTLLGAHAGATLRLVVQSRRASGPATESGSHSMMEVGAGQIGRPTDPRSD